MLIKSTVTPGGVYPHAFAFTSMTQPTLGLFAWILGNTIFRPKDPLPKLLRREVLILLVYGILQGMEIALTNKALQILTVSERTIIGSTNVLFMMLTAWFWGLEGCGTIRVISCCMLVCGSILQGVGATNGMYLGLDSMTPYDGEVHVAGISMQLASTFISTQRWALLQFILQRSPADSALGKMSRLQLLARVMPVTGLVCIPLAIIFEPDAYSMGNCFDLDFFTHLLGVCCSLIMMLSAELQLIKLVSAVAYQVLATINQIPTVLCGVLFRHDHVGSLNAYGFGCCLAGALIYGRARQSEVRAKVHDEAGLKKALVDTETSSEEGSYSRGIMHGGEA